jgi:hypothetical protein
VQDAHKNRPRILTVTHRGNSRSTVIFRDGGILNFPKAVLLWKAAGSIGGDHDSTDVGWVGGVRRGNCEQSEVPLFDADSTVHRRRVNS